MEIEVIRRLFRKHGIEDVLERIRYYIREAEYVNVLSPLNYEEIFKTPYRHKAIDLKLIFYSYGNLSLSDINWLELSFFTYLKKNFEEIFKLPYRKMIHLKNKSYDHKIIYNMANTRYEWQPTKILYLNDYFIFRIHLIKDEIVSEYLDNDRNSDFVNRNIDKEYLNNLITLKNIVKNEYIKHLKFDYLN